LLNQDNLKESKDQRLFQSLFLFSASSIKSSIKDFSLFVPRKSFISKSTALKALVCGCLKSLIWESLKKTISKAPATKPPMCAK